MPKMIPDAVLAVLAESRTEGSRLYLPGDLDRKLYTEVNKVLEANGGKWNRSAKAHVFNEDAADAIEQALVTGEFRRVKQDLGQFDTPPSLADRVVELADIQRGMKVYEPNAGIGNLVAAVIRATGTGDNVFGNEIDPKRHAKCVMENYQAFGGGGLDMRDFLTIDPNTVFDRIVMNPPFAKQADIDHVSHALKFLRPGGRLVSIMSPSFKFRSDKKARDFNAFVVDRATHFEIVPEKAFAESGTNIRTCIVVFDV